MMRFGMEPPSPFYNSSYYCASCLSLGFLGTLRLRGGIMRGGIFRHERPVRVDRVCIPLAFEARAPDRRVNGSRCLLLGMKDADVASLAARMAPSRRAGRRRAAPGAGAVPSPSEPRGRRRSAVVARRIPPSHSSIVIQKRRPRLTELFQITWGDSGRRSKGRGLHSPARLPRT